jgi:hypothetical protein
MAVLDRQIMTKKIHGSERQPPASSTRLLEIVLQSPRYGDLLMMRRVPTRGLPLSSFKVSLMSSVSYIHNRMIQIQQSEEYCESGDPDYYSTT